MEGFSSPLRKGLLLFKEEGSTNLVELDLKSHFTPMIWCLKRILGFGSKKEKKKIKEKRKIRKGNIFLFLLYFEELIFFFPPKEDSSKVRLLFKIDTCQHKEKTEFLTRDGS